VQCPFVDKRVERPSRPAMTPTAISADGEKTSMDSSSDSRSSAGESRESAIPGRDERLFGAWKDDLRPVIFSARRAVARILGVDYGN
jgi:hypothetical protein